MEFPEEIIIADDVVEDITQYKGEDEIIITAFCIFTVKKKDGKTYYLDCEGYWLLGFWLGLLNKGIK